MQTSNTAPLITPRNVKRARRQRLKGAQINIAHTKRLMRRRARRVDAQAARAGDMHSITRGMCSWVVS